MIKNYLKTAVRNLVKNKFYSLINIIGLVAGLATCLLILLYVIDELSYDRYNENADRIYRVNNEIKFGDNHIDLAPAPALLGPTMIDEFPQVEQYARLRWYGSFLVKRNNENIKEERVAYADSTLFDVFTLPMLDGNPKTALSTPHSLVISEKIANKYFNTVNAVGKTMLINDTGYYKVTGVIENIPSQSHFHFDIFMAMMDDPRSRDDNWFSENYNTYVLLKKDADAEKLNAQLDGMMERHTAPLLKSVANQDMAEFKRSGNFIRASIIPLTDIHLHSNKVAELDGNGNIEFVYIFSAIAILILLIASVNFMNLSTARSSNRAKEVGIRKVLGSLKGNLIRQFLTESLLVSFVALVVAILTAWLLLPYFNQLSGKEIKTATLFQPGMLITMVLLMLVVGFLAGSYPAFFLSSFQPIDVLKGKLAGGFKRSWLRNTLVIFQFSISIILIFGTIVIYNQLNFIDKKDIGFSRDKVIIIKNTSALGSSITAFKKELPNIQGIQEATQSGFLPVNYKRNSDAFFLSPVLDVSKAISMQYWTVDESYIPTLNIQMLDGRNFSKDFATDSTGIIINEAAAKFLALQDPLNKKIYNLKDIATKEINEYHIIGVIKNFNFSSLRDVVSPLALVLGKDNSNVSLRVSADASIDNVLSQVQNKWQSMAPGQPFDYSLMSSDFDRLYTTEQRTGKIFFTFAILAILIASLGLFGLISYASEQRVREIGIRKVLGASVSNIASMLSKDFLKLVLISSAIAFPTAWFAMHKWLQDFAYRISIDWWVFIVAGLLALIVAITTMSFQAIKAAIANPVKSLRSE